MGRFWGQALTRVEDKVDDKVGDEGVATNWIPITRKSRPLTLPLAESSDKLDESMWQLCKEFLSFLKQEKKWWLIPLVVVLLTLAGLILFSGSSVLAPFMYPFM
jgi:hypothetical protein